MNVSLRSDVGIGSAWLLPTQVPQRRAARTVRRVQETDAYTASTTKTTLARPGWRKIEEVWTCVRWKPSRARVLGQPNAQARHKLVGRQRTPVQSLEAQSTRGVTVRRSRWMADMGLGCKCRACKERCVVAGHTFQRPLAARGIGVIRSVGGHHTC